MKSKLIETKQLTNLKFLNMFQSTFLMENGKTRDYYFVSRRSLEQLGCKDKSFVDAIKVLPYFKKDGKTYKIDHYKEYAQAKKAGLDFDPNKTFRNSQIYRK